MELQVTCRLVPDDVTAFWLYHYKARSIREANLRYLGWVTVKIVLFTCPLVGVCIGLPVLSKPAEPGGELTRWLAILFMFVCFATIQVGLVAAMMITKRMGPGAAIRQLTQLAREGDLFDDHQLALTPEGVTFISRREAFTSFWTSVSRIDETDAYLFIYQGKGSVSILPRRACASDDQFAEFVRAARQYSQTAHESCEPPQ